jgi:hypothetical protein
MHALERFADASDLLANQALTMYVRYGELARRSESERTLQCYLRIPSKFSARPGHAAGEAYLSNGETSPIYCRILMCRISELMRLAVIGSNRETLPICA